MRVGFCRTCGRQGLGGYSKVNKMAHTAHIPWRKHLTAACLPACLCFYRCCRQAFRGQGAGVKHVVPSIASLQLQHCKSGRSRHSKLSSSSRISMMSPLHYPCCAGRGARGFRRCGLWQPLAATSQAPEGSERRCGAGAAGRAAGAGPAGAVNLACTCSACGL